MNISCEVILDLIPLVKDGIASDDSNSIVKDHIKNCDSCKAELETFEEVTIEQSQIKDEKIISAMKRSIFITQLSILMAGAIIGVALSNSMSMFYNFIIMPIVGGISLFTLKRKWYLASLGVFLLSYLWQTIVGIASNGFQWGYLYYGLFYSIIYASLVGVGVIITMLLKYALKKER
ncbi:zf-HC2 domain-containing protein [Clostridium sp.]|uniref:zf-HC2 domain-containing protein n=1 Tax=Clostridium sp. TaxID=1506 RepID=UPI002FC66C76